MRRISISQAFEQWRELAADIPKDDTAMLAESWNDYTDSLCEDGALCGLQYHYCPAFDDDMPDDDRGFILGELGLTMRVARTEATREGWDAGASHWRVTLRRNGASLATNYSMGSAYVGEPDLRDVFYSLLLDAEAGAQSFEDFCSDFAYDTDSRKAEKMWRACKATAVRLARLFSPDELSDLRELFEDY